MRVCHTVKLCKLLQSLQQRKMSVHSLCLVNNVFLIFDCDALEVLTFVLTFHVVYTVRVHSFPGESQPILATAASFSARKN